MLRKTSNVKYLSSLAKILNLLPANISTSGVKTSPKALFSTPVERNIKRYYHSPAESTGWTEGTRNQFHPGDIITAMRLDFIGYSPTNALGLTELVCHYAEGREYCQQFIVDGAISGFYFNVVPRAAVIAPELCKQFPALAEFAKSLDQRDLKAIFESNEKRLALIAEIEEKFGKSLQVFPPVQNQEETLKKIGKAQDSFLNGLTRKGATVVELDPSYEPPKYGR